MFGFNEDKKIVSEIYLKSINKLKSLSYQEVIYIIIYYLFWKKMSVLNKIRKFLFFTNSIFVLIFTFLLSSQLALTNSIFENHKPNICGSDERSSGLSCQSYCVLSQLDNTNTYEISALIFDYEIEDKFKNLIKFNLHILIEPKSNSPPIKI